jgi:Ca2+-binding RTX toxin-like protein
VANFDFSTITAAQALAYNAQTDMLSTPIGSTITDFLVSYDDAAGTVRITDTDSGHAVVFGSGIYGELVFGPGGQAMHIGSPGPDTETFATVNFGGAGNDTIEGGNVAFGGPGADLFDTDKANHIDQIRDWESGDSLYMSFLTPTAANYVEGTAADQSAATAFANQQIAAGKAYVVVAVGPDLFAYADDSDTRAFAGFAGTVSTTEIMGRGLNDISVSNFVDSAPGAVVITLPAPGSAGADGFVFGDMENIHLSSLQGAPITGATATQLTIGNHDGVELVLTGTGLTYDADQQLTGGSVDSIFFQQPMPDGSFFQSSLNVHSIAAAPFAAWVATDATQTALSTILSGNDQISGNDLAHPDVIHGYGGNDLLYGGGGADTIWGGDGDDTIYAQTPPSILGAGGAAATYLRGEAGNDTIVGGPVFDDINGNQGNDSLHGGAGDDWVVGGKDDDIQFGDAGNDIVWGNLGNDTLDGGDGNDQVRGGQGDDSVSGGAGDDYVSGDRGNDTISGGAGADIFHGSQDAGIDKVLDFHQAEGDRVMLDPGTTYTLSQVGADTVIDMGGGNQMILVGVQLSTLATGWIFEG